MATGGRLRPDSPNLRWARTAAPRPRSKWRGDLEVGSRSAITRTGHAQRSKQGGVHRLTLPALLQRPAWAERNAPPRKALGVLGGPGARRDPGVLLPLACAAIQPLRSCRSPACGDHGLPPRDGFPRSGDQFRCHQAGGRPRGSARRSLRRGKAASPSRTATPGGWRANDPAQPARSLPRVWIRAFHGLLNQTGWPNNPDPADGRQARAASRAQASTGPAGAAAGNLLLSAPHATSTAGGGDQQMHSVSLGPEKPGSDHTSARCNACLPLPRCVFFFLISRLQPDPNCKRCQRVAATALQPSLPRCRLSCPAGAARSGKLLPGPSERLLPFSF